MLDARCLLFIYTPFLLYSPWRFIDGMGARVTLKDAIKRATKHDLKHGSIDRAKTLFQLLEVVNILAVLLLNLLLDTNEVLLDPEDSIVMYDGMCMDVTYLLQLCDQPGLSACDQCSRRYSVIRLGYPSFL